MNRAWASPVLLLGLMAVLTFPPSFVASLGRTEDKGEKREADLAQAFARLERGMTAEQVRALVGPPKRIARQLLYHRHLEQWVYEQPYPVRLTFDCLRGQKPQLLEKPMSPSEKSQRPRSADLP
jgi:hypothetical protein